MINAKVNLRGWPRQIRTSPSFRLSGERSLSFQRALASLWDYSRNKPGRPTSPLPAVSATLARWTSRARRDHLPPPEEDTVIYPRYVLVSPSTTVVVKHRRCSRRRRAVTAAAFASTHARRRHRCDVRKLRLELAHSFLPGEGVGTCVLHRSTCTPVSLETVKAWMSGRLPDVRRCTENRLIDLLCV